MLKPRVTTFLEVTVTNGPARVYIDRISRGVSCEAAPSCRLALSPGDHKVTVKREGFKLGTDRVTVANGTTVALTVTLTDEASPLTVRVAQPGASVTVDGAAYNAPTAVAAGSHEVVVSLEGHETRRLAAVAQEGKPIDLDVTLTRIPAELHSDHRIEIELLPIARVVVPPPGIWTPRRRAAVVMGGVGLAALGTGVVLGRQAKQLEIGAPQASDLDQRGRSRALQANVAFGIAGGAAITAGILWLTGAPASRVTVTPRLDKAAGLDLAVRF